jgi:hypothetical protein
MADISTTYAAFVDVALRQRIDATIWKEAFARAGSNEFADSVLAGTVMGFNAFYWRIAIDNAAAYETALRSGRGAPGHDVDIITDGNIAAGVGAAWPPDPEPEP